MKIVVLAPSTNNVPILFEPLRGLGHDLHLIDYYSQPTKRHGRFIDEIKEINPAWVLYIGAMERNHGLPIPPIPVLGEIGKNVPLVHLCCDGSEPWWWDQLRDYYDAGHFALQINIDGVRIGPIGERGMTRLCPLDPETYSRIPWESRQHTAGFCGFMHGDRREVLRPLAEKKILVCHERDTFTPTQYREFLANCRIAFNLPTSGSGLTQHVKARIIEGALAGCVVLEGADSPTAFWFEPGVDYLEYERLSDIKTNVNWVDSHPMEAQEMAQRLRDKVIARHSPEIFWWHVLYRLGLDDREPPEVKEPAFGSWTGGPSSAVKEMPELRHKINSDWAAPPQFIESRNRNNIVLYGGQFWLLPQGLGPIFLENPEHRARPGIKTARTLEEAIKIARR